MRLSIHTTFIEKLPADPDETNETRQVNGAMFSYVTPKIPSHPKLIHATTEVAQLLGLTKEDCTSEAFTAVFSGQKVLENTQPFAMCYGGHQFGNWAGQLGDGRAILAGEIINEAGEKNEIQWKGAGATPYSRHADGRAVLRSSVREYLMSETMHHLGIPTTRALSLCFTGEEVVRDMMYSGNPQKEKGAEKCSLGKYHQYGDTSSL